MAQSAIITGISTLTLNLFTSISADGDSLSKSWYDNYSHGIGLEVYCFTDLKNLIGKTFLQVCLTIYQKTGALVIGIQQKTNNVIGQIQKQESVTNTDKHESKDDAKSDIFFDILASDNAPTSLDDVTVSFEKIIILNPGAEYVLKDNDELIVVAEDSDVKEEIEAISKFESVPVVKKSLSNFSPFSNYITQQKSDVVNWKERIIKSYEDKKLDHHIILLGTWEDSLSFIMRYEKFNLKTSTPIVILQNDKPPENEWEKVKNFSNIYIVQGSSSNLKDIERAGINKAKNLIGFSETDQKLILLIRSSKNPNCFQFVELKDIENSQLLSSVPFVDSYLDTTSFASGHVYSSSKLDTLLSQSMNLDLNIPQLFELFIGGSIFSIPVSEIKEVKISTYGVVFTHLLASELIPIGLYRLYQNGRPDRFVFTNPTQNTQLLSSDIIWVIQKTSKKTEIEKEQLSLLEEEQKLFKITDLTVSIYAENNFNDK